MTMKPRVGTPAAVLAMAQVLYRFFDCDGVLLYIGITGDAATRWSNHRSFKEWWPLVRRIEIEPYATRREVERAEKKAIRTEKPLFNVTHNRATRDKSMVATKLGRPTEPTHFTDGCGDCIARGRPAGLHVPYLMDWHPHLDGLETLHRCPDEHEWLCCWGEPWLVFEDCTCSWCRARLKGSAQRR